MSDWMDGEKHFLFITHAEEEEKKKMTFSSESLVTNSQVKRAYLIFGCSFFSLSLLLKLKVSRLEIKSVLKRVETRNLISFKTSSWRVELGSQWAESTWLEPLMHSWSLCLGRPNREVKKTSLFLSFLPSKCEEKLSTRWFLCPTRNELSTNSFFKGFPLLGRSVGRPSDDGRGNFEKPQSLMNRSIRPTNFRSVQLNLFPSKAPIRL